MKARRGWAWPLVPLYWAGLRVKDGLRALGLLPARRLGWPVVSVGSLSAGGAGKTPVVIALAELLLDRGWAVVVLSRGYGREATDPNFAQQVVPDLEDAAMRYGDEPTLISRRLGVQVWVSKDRYFAGRTAEDFASEEKWDFVSETVVEVTPAPQLRGVHLLDDGFQHRRLARAMDVVVVTAEDLEDALLPAGNLREPLAALRRADAVVVREEERESIEKLVREKMRPDAALWSAHRRLRLPDAPAGRVFVFCAIARPDGLWAMLAQAGCNIVGKIAFPDHYAYRVGDVDRLVEEARRCGATGFLTTEKDGVKLSQAMMVRLLEVGAVGILKLDVTFVDEAAVVRELEARIR